MSFFNSCNVISRTIAPFDEAKQQLMEKLDKNLLDHAAKLADGNGPQIVDVYQLQGLAEVHCYLKTAHQFDPAEVDALLQFADPLEAARYCWEMNDERLVLMHHCCVII